MTKLEEIQELLKEQVPQPVELRDWLGGTQEIYHFPNGYGASVVRNFGSYGGLDGNFELGVLKHDLEKDEWHLSYDTPVATDVLGYLERPEVRELLQQIQRLPCRLPQQNLPTEQVEYEAWIKDGMPGLLQ